MLYHGSSTGGLKELHPFISEHKKAYIYFSTDIVVAAFYAVHCVPRPYNWFPYGFNSNNIPVYTEWYRNAFEDVYGKKTGYIYIVENIDDLQAPTDINCAYTCERPVSVYSVIEIPDMYEWFLNQEKLGRLIINRYEDLNENQKNFCRRMIADEIKCYDLKNNSDCGYAKFIKKNFNDIWNE